MKAVASLRQIPGGKPFPGPRSRTKNYRQDCQGHLVFVGLVAGQEWSCCSTGGNQYKDGGSRLFS